MGLRLLALLWGFGEATFFFIVPDVLLTFVAARSGRLAVGTCLWVLVGALAGGTLMYAWGERDESGALEALDAVPGISPGMLATVGAEIDAHGVAAPLLGPIRGVPYKIYAAQSASRGIGLGAFLLVSVPARLMRFLFMSVVTWLFFRRVVPHWSLRKRNRLIAGLWAAFYVAYFAIVSG